jgi:hypothetical protein
MKNKSKKERGFDFAKLLPLLPVLQFALEVWKYFSQ